MMEIVYMYLPSGVKRNDFNVIYLGESYLSLHHQQFNYTFR